MFASMRIQPTGPRSGFDKLVAYDLPPCWRLITKMQNTLWFQNCHATLTASLAPTGQVQAAGPFEAAGYGEAGVNDKCCEIPDSRLRCSPHWFKERGAAGRSCYHWSTLYRTIKFFRLKFAN